MAIHASFQGIDFDLNTDGLDSWDALELVADAQSGKPAAVVQLVRLLFGQEQFARIKKQLPDNAVPTVVAFVTGALEAASAAKGENPKNS